MRKIRNITKLVIVGIVWLICYGVFMPDLEYYVRARGEKLFVQSLLSLLPLFTTGLVLNIENLYYGIKKKKKINKWMLALFIVVLLVASVIPVFCLIGDAQTRAVQNGTFQSPITYSGLWIKFALALATGHTYLLLWLCSGYLLTCIFEE